MNVRIEAVRAAREITSDSLRAGKGLVAIVFEIADESGEIVAVIPFQRVLEPG
jgi:hypothetical protein